MNDQNISTEQKYCNFCKLPLNRDENNHHAYCRQFVTDFNNRRHFKRRIDFKGSFYFHLFIFQFIFLIFLVELCYLSNFLGLTFISMSYPSISNLPYFPINDLYDLIAYGFLDVIFALMNYIALPTTILFVKIITFPPFALIIFILYGRFIKKHVFIRKDEYFLSEDSVKIKNVRYKYKNKKRRSL